MSVPRPGPRSTHGTAEVVHPPAKGPVVTIVYRQLPRYRIPFYERLRKYLGGRGVELRLIHGQPAAEDVAKNDTGHLPWASQIENRILPLGPHGLYWQPCLRLLRGSDLIVVEQASRLLLNYLLLVGQRLGGPKIALWGHGRNFQSHEANRLGEAIKRRMSLMPHWWFAYTEGSARIVGDLGYPRERITVVQNAVDTESLRAARTQVDLSELERLRAKVGLRGEHVAVFVGGIYEEKRIPFLLEAARLVRDRVAGFELLLIGDGPKADLVEAAERRWSWIHYLGPKFGAEKVAYCMLAQTLLMPGLVGLAVVDAFALELPLITVDLPFHSPEIEYLVDGVNGIKLESGATPEEFADAVATVLLDHDLRKALQSGCRDAAAVYTLEAMVERFGEGVMLALAAAGARQSNPHGAVLSDGQPCGDP